MAPLLTFFALCLGQGRWQQHGHLFNSNTIEGFKTFDRPAALLKVLHQHSPDIDSAICPVHMTRRCFRRFSGAPGSGVTLPHAHNVIT